MSGVRKRKIIEEEYGKPLPEILEELYGKLGSQRKVADELGVNQSTVSYWLLRLKLRPVTRLERVAVEKNGVG